MLSQFSFCRNLKAFLIRLVCTNVSFTSAMSDDPSPPAAIELTAHDDEMSVGSDASLFSTGTAFCAKTVLGSFVNSVATALTKTSLVREPKEPTPIETLKHFPDIITMDRHDLNAYALQPLDSDETYKACKTQSEAAAGAMNVIKADLIKMQEKKTEHQKAILVINGNLREKSNMYGAHNRAKEGFDDQLLYMVHRFLISQYVYSTPEAEKLYSGSYSVGVMLKAMGCSKDEDWDLVSRFGSGGGAEAEKWLQGKANWASNMGFGKNVKCNGLSVSKGEYEGVVDFWARLKEELKLEEAKVELSLAADPKDYDAQLSALDAQSAEIERKKAELTRDKNFRRSLVSNQEGERPKKRARTELEEIAEEEDEPDQE